VDTSLLLSAEDYLAVARQNRPDIELLQKALAAREQQVNLERARFWPDLFFAADFSLGYSTEEARDQQGFVTDLDGNDLPVRVAPFSNPYNYTRFGFLVGARLKYSPARQYFKLKQAEAQLAETQGLRRAALEGIELKIKKKWAEVDAERRRVEIYQRRLKAAERWRTQIGIAFESGGAEFEDFLNPIKAYYEARLKLLEAQYNYQVGLAKLGEEVGVTDIQSLSRELARQKEAQTK
jgi:outer membrane protein TolC